ncbi:MAG: hypothetical protein JWO76_983 [Nocardioides sp.]|nr:hypothetical protein [Nocardioides sp.]
MRTTQLTTGALAALATSALIGLGAATPANALTAAPRTGEPTTTHEVGNLLECTGTWKGRDVYASLYENRTYGNTIQILIGDDDDQVGGSRNVKDDFIEAKQVHGSLEIGRKRAVVEGHASRAGKKTAVHEEHDDAGQHITVDGFHRRLANDLTLTWRKKTVPLVCDNAFFYNLQVTKEDTTGD